MKDYLMSIITNKYNNNNCIKELHNYNKTKLFAK